MDRQQLRDALARETSGQRDVRIEFAGGHCIVKRALLIPEEADSLLKLTDGTRTFIVDAERVIWIEIG